MYYITFLVLIYAVNEANIQTAIQKKVQYVKIQVLVNIKFE